METLIVVMIFAVPILTEAAVIATRVYARGQSAGGRY
jgi:hypothetical protein